MTPERSGGKGTYILDRVFPGLGRIRRASGTLDRRVYQALNGMLSQLWAAGRSDVLASVRDGNLHPLEVWATMRGGSIHDLPTPEAIEPFNVAWIESLECSDDYRVDLRSKMRRFLDGRSLTLADLAPRLAEYRDTCEGPAMFNRTKAALQGFLARRVGRHHHLWNAVSGVPGLKERKAHGNPQSVVGLTALTAKMSEPFARIAWTMALTGMGPKEYWGKWRTVTGMVHILGTKTGGRNRHVPILGTLFRPTKTRGLFEDVLAEASDGKVKPYDMRRTFAVWLELAGVSVTHVRLYLGHRAQSVTDRYLWREVMTHIPEDGKRVRAWLAGQRRGVRSA